MHNRDSIQALLDNNPRAIPRALIALYNRQTSDEQASHTTSHQNGRGFNGVDAAFGTSLALQVLNGRTLTPNQRQAAAKMLRKYVGQLVSIANETIQGSPSVPSQDTQQA